MIFEKHLHRTALHPRVPYFLGKAHPFHEVQRAAGIRCWILSRARTLRAMANTFKVLGHHGQASSTHGLGLSSGSGASFCLFTNILLGEVSVG